MTQIESYFSLDFTEKRICFTSCSFFNNALSNIVIKRSICSQDPFIIWLFLSIFVANIRICFKSEDCCHRNCPSRIEEILTRKIQLEIFCHSQSKSGLKCMPENYPESVNPHLIGTTAMVLLRQVLKSRKIIEIEGAFHPQIGVLKDFRFLSRKTH